MYENSGYGFNGYQNNNEQNNTQVPPVQPVYQQPVQPVQPTYTQPVQETVEVNETLKA